MKGMDQKISDEFRSIGTDWGNLDDPCWKNESVLPLMQRIGAAHILSLPKLAWLRYLQSPMERMMLFALLAYVYEVFDMQHVALHQCVDGKHEEHNLDAPMEYIGLCAQHQLGFYRVDFQVTAFDLVRGGELRPAQVIGRVAIEVDGHDFHERTKEQARHDRRKDRFIQASGLKILRFTGSELYENPIRCAKEAIDAAFGKDTAAHLRGDEGAR